MNIIVETFLLTLVRVEYNCAETSLRIDGLTSRNQVKYRNEFFSLENFLTAGLEVWDKRKILCLDIKRNRCGNKKYKYIMRIIKQYQNLKHRIIVLLTVFSFLHNSLLLIIFYFSLYDVDLLNIHIFRVLYILLF